MTNYATNYGGTNRVSLKLPYPVGCIQDGCITILSVYNACRDGDCFNHCRCPGHAQQATLAKSLERR
jgi:hypothetical protein